MKTVPDVARQPFKREGVECVHVAPPGSPGSIIYCDIEFWRLQ